MFEGFIRVAAVSPDVKTGDCEYNRERITEAVENAAAAGAKLICLPELAITGSSCGDLFLQDSLLKSAKDSLAWLANRTSGRDETIIAGLPIVFDGKVYNAAAVYGGGTILGIVPKTHTTGFPNSPADRVFEVFPDNRREYISFDLTDNEGDHHRIHASFGVRHLFTCRFGHRLKFGVEIGEDFMAPAPPGVGLAQAGAMIIFNPSAAGETVGMAGRRRGMIRDLSSRLACGYVLGSAGPGESTSAGAFSGHCIVAENGLILDETRPFEGGMAISDIDIGALEQGRRPLGLWKAPSQAEATGYMRIDFPGYEIAPAHLADLEDYLEQSPDHETAFLKSEDLIRDIDPYPFIPPAGRELEARCEEVLAIQSVALAGRLAHTGAKKAVIGVSGGLDSTLALIVSLRAMERLGKSGDDILAVTMPAFGIAGKTKDNAGTLCELLGVPLQEIDITGTARAHFEEIGHGEDQYDIVFENAQARIRTLVLMDLANKHGGLVVGTGDLSELALGWATYSGDQMSMYGVNGGVPKTLIRRIIEYIAGSEPALSPVLTDILGTPVSPELLPSGEEGLSQKTEELIGPYDLHDFFLYHMVRYGRRPGVILELAVKAFEGSGYGRETIKKWLKVFYSRFFANQFKRTALPDGPRIGSVSITGNWWQMPGDAAAKVWMDEIESLCEGADES